MVAQIVSWQQSTNDINALIGKIPGIVQERAGACAHVMVVDLDSDFPANGMASDNIHPNPTGYEFMADNWYAAVEEYLR